MRSTRQARKLLTGALLGLLVVPGAAFAATQAVRAEATVSAAQPAGTAELNGSVQPSRLALKRHGYYYHVSVHNLVWSGWGQPTATAQGTFTFQFCVEESCSVSPFYDEPATVSLSGLRRCGGRLAYTTLALNVEGPTPDASFKGYRTSLGSCRRRGARGH